MATIKFDCPSCQDPLEADLTQAGKQMVCSNCLDQVPVPALSSPPAPAVAQDSTQKTGGAERPGHGFLESGAKQARSIFNDLQQISFKEEVLPIDGKNVGVLMQDFVFWAVSLLGIIPLLIVTVKEANMQLTMFALFFAFVWGVIFKRFILDDTGSWKWPIAAFFFTGIAGIWLLLTVYRTLLPNFYLAMPDSENALVSLLGFILQVGVWEELCKALPVFLLWRWQKKNIKPQHLVTIGVFSGLGFAAFENLQYGSNAVYTAYSLTNDYGVEGLVSGVQDAMVVVMLRSISLVFCHAVFSGIVAYFIAIAFIRKERMGALIVLGIAVAAVLHGFYDWFAGIQPTIAALLAGFSFALFYGYNSKLKSMSDLQEAQVASAAEN